MKTFPKISFVLTALLISTTLFAGPNYADTEILNKDAMLLRAIMINKNLSTITSGARNRIEDLRKMPLTDLTTVQARILKKVDGKPTREQVDDIDLLNKVRVQNFNIKDLSVGAVRRVESLALKEAKDLDVVQKEILRIIEENTVKTNLINEQTLLDKLMKAEENNTKPQLTEIEKRYLRILAWKTKVTPLQEKIQDHTPLKFLKDKTGKGW